MTDWELKQQFMFDADANELVAFFMGKSNWQTDNVRVHDITDGQFVMRAWLSASSGTNCLYAIGIMATIHVGKNYLPKEDTHWILDNTTEVAEIALIQDRKGECSASLFVESDPRRWGSDNTGLWTVGPRLIGQLWNELIENWLRRNIEQINVSQVELDRGEFLTMLDTVFGEEDLRELVFTLNIDYDNLSGRAKKDKFRELIIRLSVR